MINWRPFWKKAAILFAPTSENVTLCFHQLNTPKINFNHNDKCYTSDSIHYYAHFLYLHAAHESIGCGAVNQAAKLNSEVVGLTKSLYVIIVMAATLCIHNVVIMPYLKRTWM